jgi:hypothetical protein
MIIITITRSDNNYRTRSLILNTHKNGNYSGNDIHLNTVSQKIGPQKISKWGPKLKNTVVSQIIGPQNIWGPKLKSIRINRRKGGQNKKSTFNGIS